MTNKLDKIVDISISRSTKVVTRQGFGIPFYLGESMKLDRRVKIYSDISEVGLDFDSSDDEYKMASSAFSQEISPDTIMIGKKVKADSEVITSATNPSGDIINIEALGIGIAAEKGASITISGFNEAEYNDTFTVEQILDDNNIQLTSSTTLSATPATGSGSYTLSETWDKAVQKCFEFNSDWYGIAITSTNKDDILSVSSKIEVLKRLFLARTSDENNLDSNDVNSIMYALKQLNYDRTLTVYNSDVSNYFIDSSWLAKQITTTPGSSNWAFKSLSGIIPDNLDSSAIFSNNGNTYEVIGGVPVTRYGTVSSGEYVDVIRGVDWLQARLQENIMDALVNLEKIPYTDDGVNIIENKMREIFEEGVSNQLISSDSDGNGKYTITLPETENISLADKATRYLSGITFKAELAGAVNKVGIKGTVSI